MKEIDFSKKVRRCLREEGFRVWPVETGGTGTGFPDLFVSGHGVNTFIELKSRPSLACCYGEGAAAKLLGPGQLEFARSFCNNSSSSHGLLASKHHSFVMVSGKEGSGLYAVLDNGEMFEASFMKGYEGFVDKRVLRDSLMAYRLSLYPKKTAIGMPLNYILDIACSKYTEITGILIGHETIPGYKSGETLQTGEDRMCVVHDCMIYGYESVKEMRNGQG